LEIVPAGLYYTSKISFRSDALLYFGNPIEVEPVTLEADGTPPRDAVRLLSDRIAKALREVILDARHEEELQTTARAERIFSSALDDGGNESLTKVLGSVLNWTIVGTPGASQTTVKIVAHDNVLSRMNTRPASSWPTETFVGETKEIFFNGEPVLMYHVPNAHTDGDSIVFFRRSDVIVTGDIYRTDSYPVIDLEKGGSVQGVIDGLNLVLDLAVPEHHEEAGTFIVPGHGRISDEFDVVEYRDMVTIVRDRVQAAIAKGQTLEQLKAARPTLDWEPRYGAASGPWTTAQFVEAVYRSLKEKR